MKKIISTSLLAIALLAGSHAAFAATTESAGDIDKTTTGATVTTTSDTVKPAIKKVIKHKKVKKVKKVKKIKKAATTDTTTSPSTTTGTQAR